MQIKFIKLIFNIILFLFFLSILPNHSQSQDPLVKLIKDEIEKTFPLGNLELYKKALQFYDDEIATTNTKTYSLYGDSLNQIIRPSDCIGEYLKNKEDRKAKTKAEAFIKKFETFQKLLLDAVNSGCYNSYIPTINPMVIQHIFNANSDLADFYKLEKKYKKAADNIFLSLKFFVSIYGIDLIIDSNSNTGFWGTVDDLNKLVNATKDVKFHKMVLDNLNAIHQLNDIRNFNYAPLKDIVSYINGSTLDLPPLFERGFWDDVIVAVNYLARKEESYYVNINLISNFMSALDNPNPPLGNIISNQDNLIWINRFRKNSCIKSGSGLMVKRKDIGSFKNFVIKIVKEEPFFQQDLYPLKPQDLKKLNDIQKFNLYISFNQRKANDSNNPYTDYHLLKCVFAAKVFKSEKGFYPSNSDELASGGYLDKPILPYEDNFKIIDIYNHPNISKDLADKIILSDIFEFWLMHFYNAFYKAVLCFPENPNNNKYTLKINDITGKPQSKEYVNNILFMLKNRPNLINIEKNEIKETDGEVVFRFIRPKHCWVIYSLGQNRQFDNCKGQYFLTEHNWQNNDIIKIIGYE